MSLESVLFYAHLMCVPLVVLALLGADLPGALDYTPGQAGAAVAVVRPPESIHYQVVRRQLTGG